MAAQATADATSVVVVGSWNRAILQPPWLAANVFGAVAEHMPVRAEFPLLIGQPPRFVMNGIRFLPEYEKLTVAPAGLTIDQLTDCEAKVRTILVALSHTPVRSLGINFSFVDNEPCAAILGLFDDPVSLAEASNLEFETQMTGFTRAIAMKECVLNLTRSLTTNRVMYKFNFHYPVSDAVAASELLNGAVAGNFATARHIVAVYDAIKQERLQWMTRRVASSVVVNTRCKSMFQRNRCHRHARSRPRTTGVGM